MSDLKKNQVRYASMAQKHSKEETHLIKFFFFFFVGNYPFDKSYTNIIVNYIIFFFLAKILLPTNENKIRSIKWGQSRS